jgi:hypothetical protein
MDVIVDVWLNVTLGDKLWANINATHATVVATELVCNVFPASWNEGTTDRRALA